MRVAEYCIRDGVCVAGYCIRDGVRVWQSIASGTECVWQGIASGTECVCGRVLHPKKAENAGRTVHFTESLSFGSGSVSEKGVKRPGKDAIFRF